MKHFIIIALFIGSALISNAQVGIGNNNPQYPLDVKGQLRLRVDSTLQQVPGLWFNNYNNTLGPYLGYESDTSLVIDRSTNSAPAYFRKFVFDHKNVRLGLQSEGGILGAPPPLLLEAAVQIDNGDSVGILLDGTSLSNSFLRNPGGIVFRAGTIYAGAIRTKNTSASESKLSIYGGTSNSLNTLPERLTILHNGNTGISQPTPVARLHVRHNDTAVAILENSDVLATGVKNALYYKTGNYYTGGLATRATASNASALGLYTYAGFSVADLKERMTILDNGNIGINVLAPSARLDVDGSVRFRSGGGTGKVLTSDANGNATWQTPSVPSANTGFRSSISSNQVISVSNTDVLLNLIDNNSGIDFDDASAFNNATHAFTVPTTGMYHFDLQVELFHNSVTTGFARASVKVNGSTWAMLTVDLEDNVYLETRCTSFNAKLTAGDVIDVYVYQNAGSITIQNSEVRTFFTGYRVY